MSSLPLMKQPCEDCPFRREGGIRLQPGRITGIANAEGHFTCHKTLVHDEDDDDSGERHHREGEQLCAGWVAFNLRRGQGGQLWQIMDRLGGWDEIRNADWLDEVFWNLDEAEGEAI